MKILWTEGAWEQYVSWDDDRRTRRRINGLIKDIQRGENAGIGKPELLRGELSGFASRRITEEHRLVYRVHNDVLEIISCRYHYQR